MKSLSLCGLLVAAGMTGLVFAGLASAQGNVHISTDLFEAAKANASAGTASTEDKEVRPGGTMRTIMAPVSLEQANAARALRTFPANLIQGDHSSANGSNKVKSIKTTQRSLAANAAPLGPPSIPVLARALNYNPDLIYQYIRNNIDYYPVWGVQKGAVGALLDNQGTAQDQAALMVELLRASGYNANYVVGVIHLTAAQLRDWWGFETDSACAVVSMLGASQIPYGSLNATAGGSCPGLNSALVDLSIQHVWVKATIGGSDYVFDPSYKPHTRTLGVDLAAAAGYNAATFLSNAKSGAVINGNYVQNLNRANITSGLTAQASTLASWLRSNKPASSVNDVLGGWTIVPYIGQTERQTALPYQDPAYGLTEGTYLEPAAKPTLRLRYQGIDQTFTSDAVYGKRLSISYNASNQPELKLDGTVLGTGSAVAAGADSTITMTILHNAYTRTDSNQEFTQTLKGGGTYLVNNGWGPTGRGLAQNYLSTLESLRATGAAETSEAVLGSSLAVLGAQWLGQSAELASIAGRISGTSMVAHHQVGIAGHYKTAYVDLPGNSLATINIAGNPQKERATFINWMGHISMLESTTVQQTTGVKAVSTVSLLDKAVAAGLKIFSGTSSNYLSQVKPNLTNCTAYLPTLQATIDAGGRLLVPSNCSQVDGSWSGIGYFTLKNSPNLVVGAMISGGLSGGFGSVYQNAVNTVANTISYAQSQWNALTQFAGNAFGDPVDMVKGHFLYEHTDLDSGAGDFPARLGFQRLYSSGLRTSDGVVGKGWAHNFNGTARISSDGYQGLGEDSALDAVNALVEIRAAYDLLMDPTEATEAFVIAAIGQNWLGEQITNNAVVVRQGLNGEVFVRLPDGTYNPPPGNSARLIKNADGTYTYEKLNRGKQFYGADGKITRYDDPSGVQVKFTYSGNNLTTVENSLGRMLNFTYSNARISQVSDGTRAVNYQYDASGNLTTFTNAANQATTFRYDLPGRMTQHFSPAFPTTAVVTNVYDPLGRVETQTNAKGQIYYYLFSGFLTAEVGPYGATRNNYMDGAGNTLQFGDPLGHWTYSSYDAQSRLVRKTQQDGNYTEYTYDDATCASSEKRCTHNIKTVRQVAKPGSDVPAQNQSFTYETAFNQVATATDARGNITSTTYTLQGMVNQLTQPQDSVGVAPQTNYGYSAFSRSGWNNFYLRSSETVKIDASNSTITSTTYDTANKFVPKTQVVDSGSGKLNLTSTLTYDAIGNLTRVDGPRTDVVDITDSSYDGERRLLSTTNAAGKQTLTGYDAEGRVVRKAAQLGSQWLVSCSTYSVTGKVTREWGPALTAASTTCPAQAAPVPMGDTAYDDLDRAVTSTIYLPAGEGGNRITQTTYNLDDTVQKIQRAVGTALLQDYVTYTYNGNGKLFTSKDARGNLTVRELDGLDRLLRQYYPLPDAPGQGNAGDYEQFEYDPNNNVIYQRLRTGEVMGKTWDKLNRLVARNYFDSADNIAFAYDLRGLKTQSNFADASHNISNTWDNAGRMLTSNAGGKLIKYQYDGAGNRTTITWPDNVFTQTTYDNLNRATAIKENNTTALVSYIYDDLSRRTTITQGNGTSTGYTYDNQSRVASLEHFLAGTAQDIKYTYARNQAGDLTQVGSSNNLYQWSIATAGTLSYSTNGLNQYIGAGGSTLSYDGNANLAGDGVTTYSYDRENRLRSTTQSSITNTLSYDAEGRLWRTLLAGAQTDLLYDGDRLIGEYDSGGSMLKRYVHGPGTDEVVVAYDGSGLTSKNWFYADHQGSVVALANTTGTSTAVYTYGPFGEPGMGPDVRFRYTGQQYLPQLNLYYYKARFYSANFGRFLQTDPVGYKDDMNLYAYVGNNSLNRVDPTGMLASTLGNYFGGLGLSADKITYDLSGGGHIWMPMTAGAAGVNFSGSFTSTSDFRVNPYNAEYVVGSFVDAGINLGVNLHRGDGGDPTSVNIGFGKYYGAQINFQDGKFNGVSIGVGGGLSLPVTYTMPLSELLKSYAGPAVRH